MLEVVFRWVGCTSRIRKFVLASLVGGIAAVSTSADARTVTFQEVLNAPDDQELNLKFARQEVASGRLQQAAAALERLLLLQPNYDSIRLFYGIVLYRLNDLEAARRELALLEGRGLSPQQERDRRKYLALATQGTDALRFFARVTLGMRGDTNPSRDPDNVALITTDDDSDFGITGSSQFRIEADLNNGKGDYAFVESNAFINEFFKVGSADYLGTATRAGITLHGPGSVITPYAYYGGAWMQYERFRMQVGGGVDTSWSLTSQVELQLNGRAVHENYRRTRYSSVGDQRDGWRKSVSAGLKYRPTDRQTFRLTGFYDRKDAENDGFSYNRARIQARSFSLLGRGFYLSLTASYTNTKYDQPDNFYSTTITREDDRLYARAATGAPLESIFAPLDVELPEIHSRQSLRQVGVSYTSQASSIDRLDNKNWSGDILFTKRLAF